MDPDHDRFFLRRIRCVFPYVQIQAVLAEHGKGSRVVRSNWLKAALGKMIGLVNALIRLERNRLFEPVFADGLLPDIGNAFVRNDIVCLCSHEGAVHALDRQRLVVVVVGDRLILAVTRPDLRHHLLRCFLHRHTGSAASSENTSWQHSGRSGPRRLPEVQDTRSGCDRHRR